MKVISKISGYNNPYILFHTIFSAFKIFYILHKKGTKKVLDLISSVPDKRKIKDKDEIIKYINLFFFFLKKLNIKYTCLNRSLLICYMFKKYGLKAEIDFGIKKIDGQLKGHCWISSESGASNGYQLIFKY